MGESDRFIEYRNKYYRGGINFNINSPVVFLIIINFSVFLFVKLFSFGKITGDTSVVPYFFEKLNTFLTGDTFKQILNRPWSIVTYSFFHFEFLTIVSNMLWLLGFGGILQSITGKRNTIPVYLYGAVAGALFFAATQTIIPATKIPSFIFLYGASPAVIAIATAATVIDPGFRVFSHIRGGLPVWILTVIYLLADIAGIATSPAAYILSHTGGILAGFLFAFCFRHGLDGSAWMNNSYDWFINLFNPDKKKKRYDVKEKVFYNKGNRIPFNKTANLTQQRIDEILDKINQKGYQFLTDDEKSILKRAGDEEI